LREGAEVRAEAEAVRLARKREKKTAVKQTRQRYVNRQIGKIAQGAAK
jgi:hypothetical protein